MRVSPYWKCYSDTRKIGPCPNTYIRVCRLQSMHEYADTADCSVAWDLQKAVGTESLWSSSPVTQLPLGP